MAEEDRLAEASLRAGEERVEQRSAEFRKELGLRDLALTQILFIIGLSWVGAAGKLGPAHVVFWLLAIIFFYLPSAAVVIYLNRLMPLEGGLYQWAKLGFSEAVGFMVAWNLWLYVITNTSELGLQLTTNLAYAIGPSGAWIASNKWLITLTSVAVIALLVVVSTIGLSVGKWVHNVGGIIMLTIFAALLALPFIHVARGELREYRPLATAMPVFSLLSLNILGKLGFGALGGFEYVAILAGECRSPARTIGRSVMVAAPLIAVMFILGTSSVLAFVHPDEIDLIAPIPQVLSLGFRTFGMAAVVVPIALALLVILRIAQASVNFTGLTRLPMVAGWDHLMPAWFTKLHPRFKTPANSILFVGIVTLVMGSLSLIGVGAAGVVSAPFQRRGHLLRPDLSRHVCPAACRFVRAQARAAVVAPDRGRVRFSHDAPLCRALGLSDHHGAKQFRVHRQNQRGDRGRQYSGRRDFPGREGEAGARRLKMGRSGFEPLKA